jgi:hypothetical protein
MSRHDDVRFFRIDNRRLSHIYRALLRHQCIDRSAWQTTKNSARYARSGRAQRFWHDLGDNILTKIVTASLKCLLKPTIRALVLLLIVEALRFGPFGYFDLDRSLSIMLQNLLVRRSLQVDDGVLLLLLLVRRSREL